jgi:hypothetical protein
VVAEIGEEAVDEADGVDPYGLVAAAAAGLVAAGGDGVEGGEVVAGEGGVDHDFEGGGVGGGHSGFLLVLPAIAVFVSEPVVGGAGVGASVAGRKRLTGSGGFHGLLTSIIAQSGLRMGEFRCRAGDGGDRMRT